MTVEGRRGIFNVSSALAGHAVAAAVMLLAAVVLPRLMGPEDYGRLSAVLAVVSILFVISRLGIPLVELRFLPPLARAGDAEALAGLTSSLWTVRLIASLGGALLCVAWIGISPASVAPGLALAAGLFAFARFGFQATRSPLLPLGRAGKYAAIEAVQLVLYLAAMVAGYLVGGLVGAFLGAALVNFGLLMVARSLVSKLLARFTLGLSDRARLRSLLGYNLFAFLGAVAMALTTWLPVWLVAAFAGPLQAAYFGLAVQVLVLLTGFVATARNSLMPILVDLEGSRQDERLFLWLSWILRVSVATISLGAIVWALLGPEIVAVVLGAEFAPVFEPVAVILVGCLLTFCGAIPNGLLLIRQRAGVAALNLSIFAVVVVAGVGLGLVGDKGLVAMRASVAYTAGAGVFAAQACLAVLRFERFQLPVGRVLALMLPTATIWPALSWKVDVGLRLAAAISVVALYSLYALGLRLVERSELRYLKDLIQPGSSAGQ